MAEQELDNFIWEKCGSPTSEQAGEVSPCFSCGEYRIKSLEMRGEITLAHVLSALGKKYTNVFLERHNLDWFIIVGTKKIFWRMSFNFCDQLTVDTQRPIAKLLGLTEKEVSK